MYNSYNELAANIIAQAVQDYADALINFDSEDPKKMRKARTMFKDVLNFVDSEWYDRLTTLDRKVFFRMAEVKRRNEMVQMMKAIKRYCDTFDECSECVFHAEKCCLMSKEPVFYDTKKAENNIRKEN